MLFESISSKKCFASWGRRDCAPSIVPVVHWLRQTGLAEVSLCVCVLMHPCMCVAQLMLAESFRAVNHDINSEIEVC